MILYHYVYRITNKVEKKHYYGCRTSKIEPKDDLGKKYFSSSTDKYFIKEQKEMPNKFKYKIIKITNNKKNALELEIKLHSKFNVGINEHFYNRAKQTSTGFIANFSEEDKLRLSAQKIELYRNNPDVIEKQKESKRKKYEEDLTYRENISIGQKQKYEKNPELREIDSIKWKNWWASLSESEYIDLCKKMSIGTIEYNKIHVKGKTYEEIYGEDRAAEMKKNLKKPKSEEHKKALSESKKGVKLSEEHVLSIGKGSQIRWDAMSEESREVFREKMTIINQNEEKRKDASEKIKQKWKDPEYLEKMNNRRPRSKKKILVIRPDGSEFIREGIYDMIEEFNFNSTMVRKSLKDGLPCLSKIKHVNDNNTNTVGYTFKEIV